MGFFGRLFPYSNLHDLNLDWIMQQIQDLQAGSAEALAQILAQGISGTEFHWSATLDELIVRDAQDNELYRIKWDGDGFTLTQAGGTPLTYRVSNGTLTAPTVNGTAIRGGSAAITGEVACGSATVTGEVTCGTITPSTPVDIPHGGTGATTAAAARTALGAMADETVPISKGGTGATTAAAARTALGAVAKAGDTMTGDLTVSKSIPAVHLNGGTSSCSIMQLPNRALAFRQYSPNGSIYHEYLVPTVDNSDTNASYTLMTTRAPALAITAANDATVSDNASRRCGPITMLACRITLPTDTATGWTVVANFDAGALGNTTIYDRTVAANGGVVPLRFTNGTIAIYMSSGLASQQILINRTIII